MRIAIALLVFVATATAACEWTPGYYRGDGIYVPGGCQSTPSSTALDSLPAPREPPFTAATFKDSLVAACSHMASSGVLLNDQQKQVPFMDLKSLGETVCACTKARVFSDGRVVEVLNAPEQEFVSRSKEANFQSYFFGKLFASFFSCLGRDIEEQTNRASLSF